MKLRIKGNSIRLRLLRSEVGAFAANGSISDEVRFGSNSLRYSLLTDGGADSVHARFEGNEITVLVPELMARDWINSDRVGFEADQGIGDDKLAILVEKDFACIGRPNDPDRDDAFPDPAQIRA